MELFDSSQALHFHYQLRELRGDGFRDTRVYLEGDSDTQNPQLIRLTVGFDRDFDGVSVPYNVYALMVVRDGEVVGWWDFTNTCTGPGLSFFPGRQIQLPYLKLVGDKPQKLQIMVWGRL